VAVKFKFDKPAAKTNHNQMKLNLINNSTETLPKKFVENWCKALSKKLKLKSELTIVFLDPKAAKALNKTFRKKNYATDILSFQSSSSDNLGELILCPQVLKKQAKEHKISFNAELGYMLIHGVLHLLGYDHEKSKAEAKTMFKIQDQLFDSLNKKPHK
jgi:probable rRNA maturation factor